MSVERRCIRWCQTCGDFLRDPLDVVGRHGSGPAFNALQRRGLGEMGISTVGGVLNASTDTLLLVPWIGPDSITRFHEWVNEEIANRCDANHESPPRFIAEIDTEALAGEWGIAEVVDQDVDTAIYAYRGRLAVRCCNKASCRGECGGEPQWTVEPGGNDLVLQVYDLATTSIWFTVSPSLRAMLYDVLDTTGGRP